MFQVVLTFECWSFDTKKSAPGTNMQRSTFWWKIDRDLKKPKKWKPFLQRTFNYVIINLTDIFFMHTILDYFPTLKTFGWDSYLRGSSKIKKQALLFVFPYWKLRVSAFTWRVKSINQLKASR